ncbi:hypothetical protein ABZO31_25770 [Streptomyces sp. HUAS MG47]|uniref:hypothetical protein n=1 Tax=Streptomyces solicamelliae TaxID=3231716 RepID=UPI00387790B0
MNTPSPTPSPPPGTTETGSSFDFLTPQETRVRVPAPAFGPDRPAPGRPGVLARPVRLDAGRTAVQYRIPVSAHGAPHAFAGLEREAAASVALERRHGGGAHAHLFTRLVGYDLDAPEPFLLYRMSRDEPLTACSGALGGDQQHQVMEELTLAVRLLEDVGLVHRALAPDTVRWDGRHVRLAEPYAAQRSGDPREPFGAAPWAAPEQREGRGTADPRDDLWSVAQVLYYVVSGRAGAGTGPPADLPDLRRLAPLDRARLYAPRAADRAAPAELLRLVPVADPLVTAAAAADALGPRRAEFDAQLARKRARRAGLGPEQADDDGAEALEWVPPARRSLRERLFGGPPAAPRPPRPAADSAFDPPAGPPAPPVPDRGRQCPHCLLPVEYDESLLVIIDAKGDRIPLDLSAEHRPAHRQDALRKAYHRCPHADGEQAHELPVPYLTNGEPLSIALVGSSSVGKTHLLAAMLGEVEQGGLEPYGLKCLPLNPEDHRTFLRDRVQHLQQGRQLARTGQQTFARFADGLLVSAPGTMPRPVVFFDLAGEDLAQDGEVTRFLMGVDAFVFVLDPLRALGLPSLDPVRAEQRLPLRDLGDEAFATVLNRVPRTGGHVTAPAALAVNKSDLVRFEPTVDRWLGRALPARFDAAAVREESRDAYAFLAHHASSAWLKPFDDCARCTLHFVAATGGRAKDDRFPHGARPRRVLAPLLSVFAMCGLLPGTESREVGF